jgi:hypothetical protein
MAETVHVVAITSGEVALLDLIRDEPQLVENLRRCTATQEHERQMLERLRRRLIRALGSQRSAAIDRPERAD